MRGARSTYGEMQNDMMFGRKSLGRVTASEG